jgi:hypothetical protein
LAEHFVTLFDSSFLPQGMALAGSLRAHFPDSLLWVIAMDQGVESSLERLRLPGVRVIPLRDIEDARLAVVKGGRTAREYCWTVTSFTFDAVFERCPQAPRVTYLDADLFFFASPLPLLRELEESGAAVLVTEHNFDPAYDKSGIVGRFCVQFLAVDRAERGRAVLRWWQERVLEWCFDRREPGRFGDQKYLDAWPGLFGKDVHVLRDVASALAPWNIRMETRKAAGMVKPVFYHFHSFRVTSSKRARSVEGGYSVPRSARWLYREYAGAVGRSLSRMEGAGVAFTVDARHPSAIRALKHAAKLVLGRADGYVKLERNA